MVGLIGPDGVGKSTLMGIIAGAKKIQSGKVQVLGGDIADRRHRNAVCPLIAYMPQGLGKNLYFELSVFENIDFFAQLFGLSRAERRKRIDGLLKATGLDPFPNRPAGKLSGGMKQKVGLCSSLIHDPDLLILDEPTTGVDPLSRQQFWTLVDNIRAGRPGMSVLVSTAYMDEADRFDWLIAMDAGRILATGTPQELKQRTGTDNLEETFVALLPEGKRGSGRRLTIPPRVHTDAEPAIVAKNLTRRFGTFTAVNAVNFTIERGEIFGFLGSNGCGKSTTMKMLTGLLPATEGEAILFGKPVDPKNNDARMRVGYMSQAFSLYGELTVAQNLWIHARLYHLPPESRQSRIDELVQRFGLAQYVDDLPESIPLGVRQRLSLAVAIIHDPEMLILDEPTSGVDPVARDEFWELLIELSREKQVTIFISTHFMNEAMRCDRISLMHAGVVLACDTPKALMAARGTDVLEEAFIGYIADASSEASKGDQKEAEPVQTETLAPSTTQGKHPAAQSSFKLGRLLAYSRRETLEILRDPVRLAFAFVGSLVLMLAFGFGITTDVENIRLAALDLDQTPESRAYLAEFEASPSFLPQRPLRSQREEEQRLRANDISLAIEMPTEFGRNFKRDASPEVSAVVDGANPFRAETIKQYVTSVNQLFATRNPNASPGARSLQRHGSIQSRYLYNPSFESVYAIVPSIPPILLILIPAILMAVSVVREKELGSIINFYVTPTTRLEFLLGKQLPYIAIGMINYVILMLMAIVVFQVPLKGSGLTLTLCALLYVTATTGIGLLVSTFTPSQVAAVFVTAILTILPTTQFSGTAAAGLDPGRAGARCGLALADDLLHARERRGLHEGARPAPARGRRPGPCPLHPGVDRADSHRPQGPGVVTMKRLANIFWLGTKELRSLQRDTVLVIFVIYAFTFAIYTQAKGTSSEVHNASIAFVDEDQSTLSKRLFESFYPPRFKHPQAIKADEADRLMDNGSYMFVVVVPPHFEADVRAGRGPELQVNIDATAMQQASIGAGYIRNILTDQVLSYLRRSENKPEAPVSVVVRKAYNPNGDTSWFTSIVAIINQVTTLTMILTGAALIREREHGTIEHMLVMPLSAFEIALAKVWANALVVLVAVTASLFLVVRTLLAVPIAGSPVLFLAGVVLYLFFGTALGIFLGTITRSMAQFALLIILLIIVLQLLSGGNTPVESQPEWMQRLTLVLPSRHFVAFSQAIIYRGAGLETVWPQFLAVAGIGLLLFVFSLRLFRQSIAVSR